MSKDTLFASLIKDGYDEDTVRHFLDGGLVKVYAGPIPESPDAEPAGDLVCQYYI